jgi:hypothetical protein
MKHIFIVTAVAAILAGCGVKGDPLPPEKPAELGRGRPTYRRALKNVKVDTVKEDPEDDQPTDKENETGDNQ